MIYVPAVSICQQAGIHVAGRHLRSPLLITVYGTGVWVSGIRHHFPSIGEKRRIDRILAAHATAFTQFQSAHWGAVNPETFVA